MEQILACGMSWPSFGFANFAERSLATKMAKDPAQVLAFLDDLALRSVERARGELAELADYARDLHRVDTLEPWDVSYYSEKLRQHRYQIGQEDCAPTSP